MNLENAPNEIKTLSSERVVELDVRPILLTGGEPFSPIMDAIGRTPSDGAFRLRATFEPKPLFRVLGSKGWFHWVEVGEGDDWIVWFYQEKSKVADEKRELETNPADISELKERFPELESRLVTQLGRWTLDVRNMVPPEPMELTLALLERLPPAGKLVQLNERIPQFLLPILDERGFTYDIRQDAEGVEIEIVKKS